MKQTGIAMCCKEPAACAGTYQLQEKERGISRREELNVLFMNTVPKEVVFMHG